MSNFDTIEKPRSIIANCSAINGTVLQKYVSDTGCELHDFKKKNASNAKQTINNNHKANHVALIGGGMSSEREVSYMSCNGIASSLLELGYDVTFIDKGQDIALVLDHLQPDYVFNGLHGTYGEDGCLPGLLNIMRIPYTGCGVLSSSIAFNKKTSLDIFKSNGIKVANSIVLAKEDMVSGDPMQRPYVIKPLSQGSSVGIILVFEEDDYNFDEYEFPYGPILVEKYIKGREIQVAVLNGKALGTLEIKLLKGKRFYDYETKYTDGFAEHLCPAPLNKEESDKVFQVAEQAAKILNAQGLIRVELIFNEEEGEFYMLELNTHPGMTPLSICPEIAQKEHNISYTELVRRILKDAKFEK